MARATPRAVRPVRTPSLGSKRLTAYAPPEPVLHWFWLFAVVLELPTIPGLSPLRRQFPPDLFAVSVPPPVFPLTMMLPVVVLPPTVAFAELFWTWRLPRIVLPPQLPIRPGEALFCQMRLLPTLVEQ